eukprot:COSAG02_NODE_3846_length_6153_cov_1.953089_3_plen_41_part_00
MVLEMNKEVMFVKKRSAIMWQWKLADGCDSQAQQGQLVTR